MKLTSDKFRTISTGGETFLCVKIMTDAVLSEIEQGKTYDVEIKPHRERRSLDSNAYLWVLLDKLADKLSLPSAPVSKVDVYREIIKDVPGISSPVCVKNEAVDKLRQSWEAHGIGWLTEVMLSKLPGCTTVILYYGSSCFDTKQMSRLLDLTIEACKAQGIETMTPAELARLEGYGV